ncbi:putative cytochrome P450 hydroxylase [Streptomyces formicae]|uniref:Putative cytochrome P450 hydroxylase n=2 Tax=Streptomyces formicae TaxID=1616117 RepID=A0A291Q2F4_9ACTN|nr:putative cytochrome P450 hydroxylase [Streptomyces formicae]
MLPSGPEIDNNAARLPDKEVDALNSWLTHMRHTAPVGYDESIRAWQVFGYDEAQRILSDPSFSADMRAASQAAGIDTHVPPVIERLTSASFFTMDPTTHRSFRGLVSQAFSRRLVNRLAPRVAETATGILDELDGVEQFDLLDRFAYPLPMIVLCELLGVPHDDRRAFQSWAASLIDPAGQGTAEGGELGSELEQLEQYLHELVGRRRKEPGTDLLSRLATAEVDGEQLTVQDVVSLAAVMLLAGHNTTTMLLANLVVCLDENPASAAAIREDRGLIPSAIEEVFRYRGPLPRALRLATEDCRIGEHAVSAGAPVVVWTASANWDESQFADPDRFDIRRTSNRHLGFGHGMHFCLGAPLARVVAETAMSLLLDRCSSITVSPGVPLEYSAPRVNLAPAKLPVQIRWAGSTSR